MATPAAGTVPTGQVPPFPTLMPLDITTDSVSTAVKELVSAKYDNATAWAMWASQIMASNITDITKLLGSDTVAADLAALVAEIGTITASSPGTITGATGTFSDSTLTALQARVNADLAAFSTGLGSAEAAIFARETARVTAERALAYTELSTQFSARGFDMPPGALTAKQTEINNESSKRLTDSSGKILEESARLALDYNKHIQGVATELVSVMSKVFESREMRLFEASKATVMLSVENYKSYLANVSTKADIAIKKASVVLDNKARQLALEVTTLNGLADSAAQMVAAALNGVSVSSSLGYSGSATNGLSYVVNEGWATTTNSPNT